MQLIRRLRIQALFCALCVLACELIAHPYTTIGVCDDGPYILMARTLATTGHLVYNGWEAAMLGWQLYLGAAFIKFFGFSFTSVRMSTLLVSMLLAFVLQRTLVRAGITERNATIGTLVLVLSPLYLMLSVTFMSDITGLFAIVLCLYGCLRALQSTTDRATIAWLCFAVAANALCGTSRQIAWLGILVMLPSTLWLLRAKRSVLIAGATATLAGALFIFLCLHWLNHQPYSVPEHLLPPSFPAARILGTLFEFLLDVPFLLLPVVALFIPGIRKSRPRVIAFFVVMFSSYLFLLLYPNHLRGSFSFLLEPTGGDWISIHGMLYEGDLKGQPPIYFSPVVRGLFTIASLGGVLGLIASFFHSHEISPGAEPSPRISWKQLGILLAPFALAYILLLIPRAATFTFSDRYLLGPLVLALLWLVRYYQDRIHPQLPGASLILIGIMTICAIAITHNTFSFYRARAALAAELHTAGIPDTSIDNGWEYGIDVELQHSNHINYPAIAIPAHAYTPTPPLPADTCPMWGFDMTPHVRPLYAISFDSNTCYGPAPFAPVHYAHWPYKPGTLYIVRSTPSRIANHLAPSTP